MRIFITFSLSYRITYVKYFDKNIKIKYIAQRLTDSMEKN